MSDFYKAMEKRRSSYDLTSQEVISPKRLSEVVEHALKFTPTAFNAQEQRLVLLHGDKHRWFWESTKLALKAIVPEEGFAETKARIEGFQNGYGTILIYQDIDVIEGLQESLPMYKDNFPIWANQASGMLKYTLWTSLVEEGFGANIQHYTELIEESTNKELGINPRWKMVGQLAFGKAAQAPSAEKTFEPIEKRLLVFC